MRCAIRWLLNAGLCGAAACASSPAKSSFSDADTVADAGADAAPAIAADAPWPAMDSAPPLADACTSSDAAGLAPRACPATAPPWYKDAPPPASLPLQIGSFNTATGTFAPWSDGQWAPMHLGMRGGFGVWTVLAVRLPAGTPDPVKLRVVADGLQGCDIVGQTVTNVMNFHAVPGDETLFVNADALDSGGACVLFGHHYPRKNEFCGQWVTIHAQVGFKDGTAWGEASKIVRLYGFRQTP